MIKKMHKLPQLIKQAIAINPRNSRVNAFVVPMLFILGGIIASFSSMQLISSSSTPQSAVNYHTLILPEINETDSTAQMAREYVQSQWQTVTVKPGDTLGKILTNLGLDKSSLQNLISSKPVAQSLKALKPKQKIRILTNAEHELEQLVYPLSLTRSLAIWRHGDQYESRVIERHLDTQIRYSSGVIRNSLFVDGERAGLSQKLIMQLTTIFGWDIDFAKDLQMGDRFSVIFEERYHQGERVDTGNILAVEFINQGQKYQAIRYKNASGDGGYYTPDGNSMRKAFLRTPVNFTRISSFFTLGRFHPILHTMRAHKGVDYAAPMGTPVKATSDGRIVFRGHKSGYGNVIILQHAGNYSTLYGHMSRFANNGVSSHVKQGQVIGYVGMSGLATGPHLHYEFRINGQHKDPLKIRFVNAEPLSGKDRTHFKAYTAQLIQKLEKMRDATAAKQLEAVTSTAANGINKFNAENLSSEPVASE